MKRLLEWCLVTSALTAFPAMASGSASIVCKNTYPVMEVTYSTDGDAGAPGLFWFGVEKSDLSQGAYYDINNTWQIYVGGLYPPNQIYLGSLPDTISFEVPPPNGSHNTSAYVGWGVYGGHGVYTVPAQADVATRENMLVQNQSRMQANGTWGSEYEAVNDGQKMAWAETQKNSVDYNKYALLLTIPLVYCAPPVAEADSFSVYAGHSGSYGVPLVNDYDPESLSFGIVGISTPSHGSLSYSGSTFTYTPNAGFWGTDSYTYTIQNSAGLEASATDVVTVVALPPVAVADSASMNTNGSASFNALLNDSDPNGFTLSISSLGWAAHGTVSNSGGTITYTPAVGFWGSDSFTYTIQNPAGLTASATESMTVTARSPVAVADSASVNTNGSASFNALANDTDPNGFGIDIVSLGGAAHGSVSHSGGTITYTPNGGFYGSDSFTYTIQNSAGLTASATESMTVTARPPVAAADSASMNTNASVSFNALSNDTDPNGFGIGIVNLGGAAHGSVSNSGGTITYTPVGGYNGSDSFTYTIQNSAGLTASATESMTVTARPPVAVADSASMNTNASVSFNALSNDTDPNGFGIGIVNLGGAAHGSVSNSGGTITYTPNGGFYGSDSFTYTIQNIAGLTAAATESMTVTARAPVALADSSSSSTNASTTFNVLGNDSDPQGLGLTIVSAGPAAHGSVSYGGANITFTPAANWWGTDTFPYTIRNAAGLTASATETVTINARPPVALSDSSSTSAGNGTTFNALGNDSDPQGLGLTIVSAGPAAHGSLSFAGANVTYTPNTGWWGTDMFPYTIRNAAGLTASATETVNVSAPVYPAPTGSLAANPTSVTSSSQAIALNWNCTNSSSATPLNFSGGSGTTGSATVTESATTTWQLRCNGLNGTNVTPTATVTYSAPSVPPPDMWIGVMDLDQNDYTGTQYGMAVVGNTQLYLDYGCGDQGMTTHASDPSLFTWSSDTFDVNSSGRRSINWPGYEIPITISQRTTFTITCTRKSDGGTMTGMVTLNWTAPPE